MQVTRYVGALAIGSVVFFGAQAQGNESAKDTSAHDHAHEHDKHGHSGGSNDAIYKGYFEDSQVKARALSDWEGDWQSVYPYLKNGTLDPVLAHKAKHGEKSAEEYRKYYQKGYKTDVDRIVISGDSVTFHKNG